MVIINNIDEARIAANNAISSITLINAQGSIDYLGLPYIKTMMEQIKEEFPDKEINICFDAKDNISAAFEALSYNFNSIYFSGIREIYEKLKDIATTNNQVIIYKSTS